MYNGYVYVKLMELLEKRCGSGAGLSECQAKIKVKDEVVIGTLHDHTHAPDSSLKQYIRNSLILFFILLF